MAICEHWLGFVPTSSSWTPAGSAVKSAML
jgi:hypothetical protein